MAPSPSTDNVTFRLPRTNSSISGKVSFSRFCRLIVIHQQDAFSDCGYSQAHLALETILRFRLIPHWNQTPRSGPSCIEHWTILSEVMIFLGRMQRGVHVAISLIAVLLLVKPFD